jgi:hypothetical protein
MTQSQATRSIIDTHRHIFGPKLRQKFVENIGFDDSKPLPQANAGEMFFYRESVDVDYCHSRSTREYIALVQFLERYDSRGEGHSQRHATMGSTFEERRAGMLKS